MRPAIVVMTMALTIKVFDLLLQHFLSICPKVMDLFKFWWFLMLALPRLTLIGFFGTKNCACWRLLYHVPHQSQLNTQSSRLSPRTPSFLENPLTFFTKTRHPLQYYHLSFFTKEDCIFSCNTVVNIGMAPRLLVFHIIT
jgi:hypothetical protein